MPMKWNLAQRTFATLCNKKVKWGNVKRTLNRDELYAVQKKEWRGFWARMSIPEPDWTDQVVIDYGCGQGYDSLFMLERSAAHVYALEVETGYLRQARDLHQRHGFENATYIDNRNPSALVETMGREQVDGIVCRNVMEHVPDPRAVLRSMYDALRPGGTAYIGFSPLYKSPYGAHIYAMCRVPWVHLVFAEETVISVLRELYNLDDSVQGYLDIPGSGVNKMSYFAYKDLLAELNWQIKIDLINCSASTSPRLRIANAAVKMLPIRALKELFIISSYVQLCKPL